MQAEESGTQQVQLGKNSRLDMLAYDADLRPKCAWSPHEHLKRAFFQSVKHMCSAPQTTEVATKLKHFRA